MRELALRVWFDEFELKRGDNIVAQLNMGINASRFGVLVLSERFFAKDWTKYELDSLEYLAVTDDRVLFPIWHNIGAAEVRAFRPSLANILGWNTATQTVDEIAADIHESIIRRYIQEQSTRRDDM